ncbi:hypothetical protein J437_LFUL005722 [Ladona fulva]|uniref:Metalloendopeptidase n=1 Tax=Ladona fulva TaxID=123851 RepID=A0A8K0K4C4_LADFU|nr:hypothetical protein J437_LFUL005722 [Ladona fulva]
MLLEFADASEEKIIRDAMEQFHKLTCIRFVEHQANPFLTDYIYIDKAQTGCWSSVGKLGGRQVVNLQSPGCLSTLGTPIHELMHAVGFLHEQNRWERDTYIKVKWENIQKGREVNFEKSTKEMSDALGVAYDYRSVMHYSPFAFSTNGEQTISTMVII